MKILSVGYFHGAGGAQRQLIMLSNMFAEKGNEVYLCVMADNKIPYELNKKISVVDITCAEKEAGLSIINRYIEYKKVVKKIKPDIILCFNLQTTYLSVALPKKYRKKIVYSERNDPSDKEYKGILGVVRYLTFKYVDGFVFQTKGARDYFDASIRSKSVIIPNSISISSSQYQLPRVREKRIVNVGRLHPQKNQLLLIESFAKIVPDFPDYILEIYGDGQLKDFLTCKTRELGVENRVRFIPSQKNIHDCINNAALFVLTSDYEGMPNALMEAMVLGLPCISTDCSPGGARDLIENDVNGIIVPCRNAEILAEKMKTILSDPVGASKIGIKAMEIERSHSKIIIFEKWNSFFRKILS